MSKTTRVCVLGGTGFVGHAVVRQLVKHGCQIKVLTRRRERHRELLVLPTVEVLEADIHSKTVLQGQFANMDAVINLVGILNEEDRKTRNFQSAHVRLARNVVDACRVNKVRRLLHMSALGADANRGSSKYLRSKGEAENIVNTTKDIHVTTFRPSVIFGPEDSLLNRFATILALTPIFMPLPLACGRTKFAPVYVEDVARAFVDSLDNKATFGQRYNLCGPKQYELREIVSYVGQLTGRKRLILPLGQGLSQLQAGIMGILPGKMLTTDNVNSMRIDSVCEQAFPSVFGFTPTSLETVAPQYLARKFARGYFDLFRRFAGR